ncbi:MAG: TIM barrel protein [Planctomycetota bacterium]
MKSGLVSITFRQLDCAGLVDVAARAGLQGIEWGGDVHVPHGDTSAAHLAARMTTDAGLAVAAYGSYFSCQPGEAFGPVLETAKALGTPVIRIWPGDRMHSNPEDPAAIADACRSAAEQAAALDIVIAAEWHGNTLTETLAGGLDLHRRVDHPNFKLYWQPSQRRTFEQRMAELEAVLPWLAHVHTFNWINGTERQPLAESADDWQRYLTKAATAPPFDRYAMIEFVPDDDPAMLNQEAAVLNGWLGKLDAAS